MTSQVATVLIAAGVGVLTTLLTVVYGPAWKTRLDRRREQQARSERLLSTYSEPLARAAFDLQSRLYSILRHAALADYQDATSHISLSTLWLFGQYLAWVEILRREVQVLDMGDLRKTSLFQRHLFDIADVFASATNIRDRCFNIWRANQRAIGESMVVERMMGGEARSDCMGFAEFTRRMRDPEFACWFETLGQSVETLSKSAEGHSRPIHLQRALIDLIDFLDSNRIRFPDTNERGKIPLPSGVEPLEGRKRQRPPGELALFRYAEGDPWQVFEAWAQESQLKSVVRSPTRRTVQLRGTRWQLRSYLVVMNWDQAWVELEFALGRGLSIAQRGGGRPPSTSYGVINDLLKRFDRPLLIDTC